MLEVVSEHLTDELPSYQSNQTPLLVTPLQVYIADTLPSESQPSSSSVQQTQSQPAVKSEYVIYDEPQPEPQIETIPEPQPEP